MATYPDNATAPTTAFPVATTVAYTNTGAETVFNLSGTAEHSGEVLAFADGVTQATTGYSYLILELQLLLLQLQTLQILLFKLYQYLQSYVQFVLLFLLVHKSIQTLQLM
jgi:hypothetical protein